MRKRGSSLPDPPVFHIGTSHAQKKLCCLLRVLSRNAVVELECIVMAGGRSKLPEMTAQSRCSREHDAPAENYGCTQKCKQRAHAR
jgi:hypothetical protein